jgi:prevent-host-death family protein
MARVGAFEAKTHLSQLLDRVAKGESITIEKHGVPVAVLNPVGTSRDEPVEQVIAALKEFRSHHRLRGLSIRDMIEEGRR